MTIPIAQISVKPRKRPRVGGACLIALALGPVWLGGCGGGGAPMSGNVVIETPEEREQANADSKREAEEEAAAARKGAR